MKEGAIATSKGEVANDSFSFAIIINNDLRKISTTSQIDAAICQIEKLIVYVFWGGGNFGDQDVVVRKNRSTRRVNKIIVE